MSIVRWFAPLLLVLAASGCAEVLGLDSGVPIEDDGGELGADGLPVDGAASGDAGFSDGSELTTETDDAGTTDPDPGIDASTLVCPPNKADCNGNEADGCETNLDDAKHCGSCTNACPAKSACKAEACCLNPHAACTADSQCCSGRCEEDGCH